MIDLTPDECSILLDKIHTLAPAVAGTDCHIYTGTNITEKGMIHVSVGVKTMIAHTFLYRHVVGEEIPINQSLARTCDNPLCLNPAHLYLVPKKKDYDPQEVWERILKKGTKQDDGCLVTEKPYTSCKMLGKMHSIHRISYMIHNNLTSIPSEVDGVDMEIRHLCNNPCCFNPEHLKLGNKFENNFDDKITAGTLVRGEDHHGNKITEEKARAIKMSKPSTTKSDDGHITQKQRAEDFGVPLQIVKCIDSGKSWAHLPDKDGNTGSLRKEKARDLRKNANERIGTPDMFDEAAARVKAKTIVASDPNIYIGSPCENWSGTITNGYGRMSVFGKTLGVHNISAMSVSKQFIDDGKIVRHLCGNRLCCRVDHLSIGTTSENSIDSLNHGTNHLAVLDAAKVKEIRATLAVTNTAELRRSLADKFNVSLQCIKYIISGVTWKHVI